MNTARNNESAAATVGEGNPYLQPITNEQQKARTDGEEGPDNETEHDDAGDRAAEEKKRKQRRRRRIALAFIAMLLAASVIVAVAVFRQRSTKIEYGHTGKQTGVLPATPGVSATGRDSRTDQAIQEVQRLTNAASAPIANGKAATANASENVANKSESNVLTHAQPSFTMPGPSDATQDAEASERGSSAVSVTAKDRQPLRSQRNSETSLYVSERNDGHQPALHYPQRSTGTTVFSKDIKTEAVVVLPPFGSMLPVRTIGALYTLRSGAVSRFELTRDLTGNGWTMKRGTILIGTTKRAEYDRAYVSIVGFIDPQSARLVKLGGDVLGGDGAAGLKGRSRHVDGRWARVLSQVGNAALTVTGALLGGRSNGTVIISDGGRSPLLNPISGELDGVLGSQLDRNGRAGFVEVVAGTPGYVMVTDLPATIKGTDANAELDEQTLAALSDVNTVRPETGISEREFAELIANSSPEEIKAKLHRMTPEMRRIALAVLER